MLFSLLVCMFKDGSYKDPFHTPDADGFDLAEWKEYHSRLIHSFCRLTVEEVVEWQLEDKDHKTDLIRARTRKQVEEAYETTIFYHTGVKNRQGQVVVKPNSGHARRNLSSSSRNS